MRASSSLSSSRGKLLSGCSVLDPELAGRIDRLLQNGASITSAGKREMLGWRQILLKNCEHRALP